MPFSTFFCLPCQDGGDEPCEAPAVWCEFVSKVEAQLNSFDDTLARTGQAIPLASISIFVNGETFFGLDQPIQFESVDIDTDDMVDLSVSSVAITPSRNGVYMVQGYVVAGVESPSDGLDLRMTITSSNAENAVRWNPYIDSTLISFPEFATSLIPWDSGVNGPITVQLYSDELPLNPFTARLTVFWVCDL